MVPPNILMRLATSPDVPKEYIPPKVSKYARPLDCCTGKPYLGELRVDTDTLTCYKYIENGWKEIK